MNTNLDFNFLPEPRRGALEVRDAPYFDLVEIRVAGLRRVAEQRRLARTAEEAAHALEKGPARTRNARATQRARKRNAREGEGVTRHCDQHLTGAVSYTHLTLPTNREV